MIYVPKGFQYVEAFRFDSWPHNESEAKRVGMKQVPPSNGRCDCGRPLSDHALLDNQLVCPGLYVLYSGTMVSGVMRPDDFLRTYKALSEAVVGEIEVAEKESGETEGNSESKK